MTFCYDRPGLENAAALAIEPASLQFIEREFADILRTGPRNELICEIHDALFHQRQSVSTVRSRLLRQSRTASILAVTSGKGGVGKTTVSVNLAAAFAARSLRVLLFDADLGMANVHVFAGVRPRGTLADVVGGRTTLAQIITPGPSGIQVICGASGVAGLADLGPRQLAHLTAELVRSAQSFDLLLIDTGAGISAQVIHFLSLAHQMIVVATPNLAATLDAYGVIKVAREAQLLAQIQLLVNEAENDAQATSVFNRIRECSQRFLHFAPEYLGALRRDSAVEEANQSRQPLVIAKPRNKNARRLVSIAEHLAAIELSRTAAEVAPPESRQCAAA